MNDKKIKHALTSINKKPLIKNYRSRSNVHNVLNVHLKKANKGDEPYLHKQPKFIRGNKMNHRNKLLSEL